MSKMDITDMLSSIEYGHRANIFLSERRAANESKQSTIRLYRHWIDYLAANMLKCLIVSSENRQIFSPVSNTLCFIPNLIFFWKRRKYYGNHSRWFDWSSSQDKWFFGTMERSWWVYKTRQTFFPANSYISSDARYLKEMEFNAMHQVLYGLQGRILTPEYKSLVYQEIQQVQIRKEIKHPSFILPKLKV